MTFDFRIIHGVCEMVPTKQFILAVEQTPCTLKQIVKSLSKTMGSGKTKEVTLEEAFLYSDVTVCLCNNCVLKQYLSTYISLIEDYQNFALYSLPNLMNWNKLYWLKYFLFINIQC